MTTPNLEQIIAEHPLYYDDIRDEYRCKCGWEPDDEALDYTENARVPAHEGLDRQHAAHVVAAIRDSGLTVIALPEEKPRDPAAIGTIWDSAMRVTIWDNNPGIITIPVAYEPSVDDEGIANLTPDGARDLAAALLAAAQVAERNNP